ncbi:b1822442-f675-4760-befb-42fddaf06ee5 [Thermothielavioides terrestris]|uniref:B1822442-f675-4760-befb-42fddaf06ee5 n=1 Tax=Thermothielavioides terrestris TaxID=2587410 RepID=A0A3S4ATH5_9PEZI|nr:b1822442-f675-4760-befb-42fddaf06ee5 [Thermothielavioides terrestris]
MGTTETPEEDISLGDSAITQSRPPSYREKPGSFRAPSAKGFYAPEKVQQPQEAWPPRTVQGFVAEPDPVLSSNAYQQPQSDPNNMYPARNPLTLVTTMTNPPALSHQPQESFSSTNAAHFGALMSGDQQGGLFQTDVSPVSYYNPTLMTQQFTAPYQPIYRQPSRAMSEVSSLSSGFGDGELMVTNPPVVSRPAPTAAPGGGGGGGGAPQHLARFSWMAQAQEPAGGAPELRRSPSSAGRRETVYTDASEDRPARFRSVRSWVDQQTGRIRRAQRRLQDGDQGAPPPPGNPGIPGIPNPPEEQNLRLMMDDDEKPRRVEDVMGLGTGLGLGGKTPETG